MKKVLALFLAVLMLGSCLGMSASAATDVTVGTFAQYTTACGAKQTSDCVVVFYNNGGTFVKNQLHYSLTEGERSVSGYSDVLVWAPTENHPNLKIKETFKLPDISKENNTFRGWRFDGYTDNSDVLYTGNDDRVSGAQPLVDGGAARYTVDARVIVPSNANGKILMFTAEWEQNGEEDTLGTILSVLIKVFGAIIGILMYNGDTEAGAAMMEKVLGGIL